jgi:flagellar basal body-associated protein FliL
MAEVERDEAEGQPAPKPARPKRSLPKPSGGGGGSTIATVLGWAIALAALAAVFMLYKQVATLKQAVAGSQGPTPRGAAAEANAAPTEPANVDDWQADAQQVTYELGKFTSNTADGRHAQMEIALLLESYYRQEEWDAYNAQMTIYEEKMKAYLDQQSGVGAEGDKKKKKKGEEAVYRPGVIVASYAPVTLAAEGEAAPVAAAEPPTKPERPLTRMEVELQKEDAKVRDIVLEQINLHTATDLTSADGREAFKKAIIDKLNLELPQHVGTVLDIYFRALVTT